MSASAKNASTMPTGEPQVLADMVSYAAGAVVSRTLVKQPGGNVTLFSFGAGQGLSEHTAPFDALVTILDGQADITIGGKTQVVSAGQSILMPAGVPHALHSDAQFKMLLVMVRDLPQ